MDVSIVIVNYNTCKLLKNCINSIYSNTKDIEYEIIVVDNSSSDGSQEMIKKDYPKVKLIESKENLGFGKANNLGSEIAKGKYLFYLNSDTLIKNNAIKIFYNFIESSKDKIGAIGCILKDENDNNCHSYGNFLTLKNDLMTGIAKYLRFLKSKELLSPPSIQKPMNVEYITGADLFVPKKVFDVTQGFDPHFFMYCEEIDWEYRMKELGYERIIIPGPQITHLEGGSDSNKSHIWSPSRLINNQISKRVYLKKHNNSLYYYIYRLISFLIELPAALILPIFYGKNYLKFLKYI